MPDRPKPPSKPGQRFNKACDSCHISKVRCTPDPQSPNGTCKRCTKNGTPCVFSPVGPRRRPVRTKNDRIAELERRVRDMQLKLEKEVEKRSSSAAVPSRRDDGQARTHAPSKHGGGKAPVSGLRSAASEFDPKSNSSGSTIAAAGAALAVTGSDVQPSQVSSSSASDGPLSCCLLHYLIL
ncbi:hypothetical protein M406DRAFT_347744 [Cryphonectria parasitica EP155]|uniref:Zn(2)-C6 fungal-type domain-containing protein n=1 Tax=Cryphonectria parasitica (strain ATCC 38755 / EP155) TaxID=660469 RepID=A0A9P4XU15_CRYP1|nr:uncharacterized protein M406DRAFT_347744 [Cryphonectria parasitica EP155]KAF3761242.1 hypothetical protein M406DRAFT_347744 [Cryphonectria parasitica EP155]